MKSNDRLMPVIDQLVRTGFESSPSRRRSQKDTDESFLIAEKIKLLDVKSSLHSFSYIFRNVSQVSKSPKKIAMLKITKLFVKHLAQSNS